LLVDTIGDIDCSGNRGSKFGWRILLLRNKSAWCPSEVRLPLPVPHQDPPAVPPDPVHQRKPKRGNSSPKFGNMTRSGNWLIYIVGMKKTPPLSGATVSARSDQNFSIPITV